MSEFAHADNHMVSEHYLFLSFISLNYFGYVLCGNIDGRRVWGRVDTCLCMGESLHCSSETVTIFLIGYPQAKNKRSNYRKQNCASSVRGMSSNPGCGIRIPCFKGQS